MKYCSTSKHTCSTSNLHCSDCEVPVVLGSFPPLVLPLVHRPHCPLPPLHAHEARVQAQVMAHSVLQDAEAEIVRVTTPTGVGTTWE